MAQSVDFNGAVRVSDYSTSGVVTSWKVGVTDKATDELLLRGTYSRDIRAPFNSELYTIRSTNFGTVIDPTKNGATVRSRSIAAAIPSLNRKSQHYNGGCGLYPEWVRGLSLSVDWFAIDMKDTVAAASQQLWSTIAPKASRRPVQILCVMPAEHHSVNSNNINLNKLSTNGVDVEATHHADLGGLGLPGSIDSHLVVSYVGKMTAVNGTLVNSSIGILKNVDNAPAQLRWRGSLTETYTLDSFKGFARLRYLSGGLYQTPSRSTTIAWAARYISTSGLL